jgi:hypothetical protein
MTPRATPSQSGAFHIAVHTPYDVPAAWFHSRCWGNVPMGPGTDRFGGKTDAANT